MKKAEILSSAFNVWQTSMFSRTSLTPLAQRLGVSKAAIYRYFPGKESLNTAMEHYFARKYAEASEQALTALSQGDLETGIEGYTRELAAFLSGNPGFISFFISRLYHQFKREELPFWNTLLEEAGSLHKRFVFLGLSETVSEQCTRYFYTHLLSWAQLLTGNGLHESEVYGYVPVILTSFFEGFAPRDLPEVPYAAIEKEIQVSPGDLPQENTIIRSLLSVVAKEGIEGATINRIAEQAGYSKSTLYSYFKNKNSMILTILRNHTKAINRLYENHCAGNYPINETIYRLILLISRYLGQTPSFLVTLNWLRFQSPRYGRGSIKSLKEQLPCFIRVMADRECRSFGLAPEKLMKILWFQLIREIMNSNGNSAIDAVPQENTAQLRSLQILFCEGLEGIRRRRYI
ncbi:TetR/AcrR family transcriptional regulator [Marispirochaeta sp.]|uniref:TetR/AcrR family transcriptional regulator n=1 Tax=Marispirochaeta sp. TaxID=2038653 RepID=UPI0029C89873|nr:TetR/AcrR family transcriptional regulator [Marispirochaeta sp.]